MEILRGSKQKKRLAGLGADESWVGKGGGEERSIDSGFRGRSGSGFKVWRSGCRSQEGEGVPDELEIGESAGEVSVGEWCGEKGETAFSRPPCRCPSEQGGKALPAAWVVAGCRAEVLGFMSMPQI